LATGLIGLAVIGANVLPSAAQQAPITVEPLSGRAVFTDDVDLKVKVKRHGEHPVISNSKDPSRTVVARITVQPDAEFGWHTHAGPVVVNVTQGELVYVPADNCAPRSYPAGTAFVDPGHGHVHNAFNPTGEPTVLVATFFEAPESGSLLIPAHAPADCSL
jgi:quercetin dioxygenase-like cupin family protein